MVRRIIMIGMGVLAAGLILWAGLPAASRLLYRLSTYKRPQIVGVVVRHVNTDRKVVALTYDDGPNPPFTDALLDCLKAADVRATFFVLGREAQRYPQVVRRAMAEGHEIGNHSWTHEPLVLRSPAFVRRQIVQTDNLLRQLGYTNEIYFRAPEGRKLLVLPLVLKLMQKKHVLFDVVALDWVENPVETMLARVRAGVRPGSIILMHDGGGDRSATVQLTRQVIETLGREGYSFCTISELLRAADASPSRISGSPEASPGGHTN